MPFLKIFFFRIFIFYIYKLFLEVFINYNICNYVYNNVTIFMCE